MVRYLIQRPVAVLLSFLALLITGLALVNKVPVSLLPDVNVPQIIIRVNYANTPASEIERQIIEPLRENLAHINKLKDIESLASNHTGLLYLNFDHGTRMDLSYIAVNEKLDALSNILPKDMERPQVIRINTSDIPVIRIQVTPKEENKFIEVSDFTEKVLKKRLEQLKGVSLVDINGRQRVMIAVTPYDNILRSLRIDKNKIFEVIQNGNTEPAGMSIKDGQYTYFVKIGSGFSNRNEISALSVQSENGTIIPIGSLAKISYEPEMQMGYHLFNNKKSLVITVQKQNDSRMNELVPLVKKTIHQFSIDYPSITFDTTQDQTFLLNAGIDNLYQDIIIGGILTIVLLFMFLGNWASPLLMAISIPLSLIISVIFFYLFHISFNIISLSGIALGVGMLIDNSIVVIDSITRKRRTGVGMLESSIEGTNEVMTPVISQVLTTVAVYAPLILLSGIGGVLVNDQSIALTISLCVSLFVAFVLSPLLYRLFLDGRPAALKEDTVFFKVISVLYHKMISHILRHRIWYFMATLLIMPLGIWFAFKIPTGGLPKIEKKESLVRINWNAPIDAEENLKRTQLVLEHIQAECIVTEAETGITQFLLQQENNDIQKSEIYFSCNTEHEKMITDAKIRKILKSKFYDATINIIDAPNAFTQLFASSIPYFEAKFRSKNNSATESEYSKLDDLVDNIKDKTITPGPGTIAERGVLVKMDAKKMDLYGVSRSVIETGLTQVFGTYSIASIRRFGEEVNVTLQSVGTSVEQKLESQVRSKNGALYPLKLFVELEEDKQPKYITGNKSGQYRSILFEDANQDFSILSKQISTMAAQKGFSVDFSGQYFEHQERIDTMKIIFIIVLLLIYFILAIQYENLILPVLVMLTIPLGIAGSMFLLWQSGGRLDVMAAIGFIVVLGLIVDDPTLKIDVLIKLEKKYVSEAVPFSETLLQKMIHEACDICLKPLLLVSLTTSIAMVPVLLISGIGNDLQKPMAIVIIGGLTIGTFFTTWFIPLAYWYYMKCKYRWLRHFKSDNNIKL